MLGFRYNDPSRPFVMGSLFNGTIGTGTQDKSHIKSIFLVVLVLLSLTR